MTNQEHFLEKRFLELAGRAFHRGCWIYSEFLNLAEQDILRQTPLDVPYTLFGGYDGAERKIAAFGSDALCGYAVQPPLRCLQIIPTAQKFAGVLSHRDFLGALMHLGIRRETLGDILLEENSGYLFCLESVVAYISQELTRVKHAPVAVAVLEECPQIQSTQPEPTEVVAASVRVDAMLAAVYHFSRTESQRLLCDGKVWINSRQTLSAAANLVPGDLVSVRGTGRFLYEGPVAETRKGRLRLRVRIYS